MEIKNPHESPAEVQEIKGDESVGITVRSDLSRGCVSVQVGKQGFFNMRPDEATRFANLVHKRAAAIRKHERQKRKGGV